MAFIVPQDRRTFFTPWDVQGGLRNWPDLFAAAGRSSQNVSLHTGVDVENGKGDQLLRRYAAMVSHNAAFDADGAVQNMTEFKMGGGINVAIDQHGRLGLIWNWRCFVPAEHMAEYQALWRECSRIHEDPEKKVRLSDEKRLVQYKAFLLRVSKFMGTWSLELARGYASPTKTAAQTGAGEAEEELRVKCLSVEPLCKMGEDGAQNPALNDYWIAMMDVQGKPTTKRDLWENIAQRAEWLTRSELHKAMADGYVLDPYTPAALYQLMVRRPDVYDKLAA